MLKESTYYFDFVRPAGLNLDFFIIQKNNQVEQNFDFSNQLDDNDVIMGNYEKKK